MEAVKCFENNEKGPVFYFKNMIFILQYLKTVIFFFSFISIYVSLTLTTIVDFRFFAFVNLRIVSSFILKKR